MVKWFNDKLEKRNLRKYTNKRLNENRSFNKISRKLSITNWLIIINVIFYILLYLFFPIQTDVIDGQVVSIVNLFVEDNIALKPNSFFSGSYWTLFTSMFSHIFLYHLFFNMISLFFIGNFLEKIIGRKKYLWFYLASGIFAGLFFAILSFYFGNSILGAKIFVNPAIPSVGASGAIFGIAGLLAILTPNMKVYLIAGPIFAIILQAALGPFIQNPQLSSLLNIIITFYIFFAIFSMFSFNPKIRRFSFPLRMSFWVLPIIAIVPLVIVGLFVPLPIGNMAHLGGLIAGFAYGYYLKTKYKRKTAMIEQYFS